MQRIHPQSGTHLLAPYYVRCCTYWFFPALFQLGDDDGVSHTKCPPFRHAYVKSATVCGVLFKSSCHVKKRRCRRRNKKCEPHVFISTGWIFSSGSWPWYCHGQTHDFMNLCPSAGSHFAKYTSLSVRILYVHTIFFVRNFLTTDEDLQFYLQIKVSTLMPAVWDAVCGSDDGRSVRWKLSRDVFIFVLRMKRAPFFSLGEIDSSRHSI